MSDKAPEKPDPQESIFSKTFFNLRLAWNLFWDGDVRFVDKLIPLAVLIYVLSPFDLLPESMLGFLGLADDAIVVQQGITYFFSRTNRNSPQTYLKHYKALKQTD